MLGHDYFAARHGAIEERLTRMSEWGFAGSHLSERDLLIRVPTGWHPLVKELHKYLLIIEPAYLFWDAYDRDGRLEFVCLPEGANRVEARRLVEERSAASATICAICGGEGRPRPRERVYTLCDECSAADRAAARERGERYANLALLYFMSCDPAHPTPDELEAWLDSLS